MAGGAVGNTTYTSTNKSGKYLIPLILVTSLFFLWGLAYGLLDVLNKHFQEVLDITKRRSTLLQAAYFGAYFLMALPAGLFMNRFGYKRGIIMGLLLYAGGAFLFYPAAHLLNFNFFLLALFILACGLTCLETAANPYVTVLGSKETSEQRLNLSQCFNGLGSFLGPVIGAELFFGGEEGGATGGSDLATVQLVYIIIAAVVLLIAFFFYRTSLPEIKEDATAQVADNSMPTRPLLSNSHFVWGVITQFFYVAAQVGIAALFVNYVTEYWAGMGSKEAAKLLSVSLLLFTIGRFAGTAIMKKVAPNKLLAIYALVNVALCAVVIAGQGASSVYALMAVFFFMSIMFPTIFALGVKDLGANTKKGSSFIIMSIVGGALMPYFMGLIADVQSTAMAYIIPMFCFLIVFYYGWRGYQRR
ncbi:L-fucose:H+ symporter permease [Chitinophaga pendula]|uniref:L-fucose:H+ symporter permease n=1 Tax=Chitinophaga TaxID=79328 RepID=UPI000BAF6DF2|nr:MULTISPECIES: L-fucose:H+ symporter permease [Chitinophaga]ASZ11627.1 L-fucose:H+ symporter permease [Chitinophaga sp. MD30]UCJ05362.1 L-fucose:H+ symporter permease [Chitinophaga pendula]